MRFRDALRVAVVSAASCVAFGAAVPSASALDLAPGVRCEGARCTNDNGEAYIVHGFVTCSVFNPPRPPAFPGEPQLPPYTTESRPWTEVFEPHTTRDVDPGCAGGHRMGWNFAGAYPRSQVPTGSAIPSIPGIS